MSASSAALLSTRIGVIEAIRDGAAHVDTLNPPVIGPSTYDTLRYPYVEVLPESSGYQGSNEYEHLIRLNIYFERERDRKADHPGDAYLGQLATTFDAVDAALDELKADEDVITYLPTTVEDYAGELDNTLIVLVSVQFRVTTVSDLADT